jgi:hypothetical protein
MDKFIRDPESSAIINADRDALAMYKLRRQRLREMKTMQDDINTLKSQLSTIIELLQSKE